MHPRRVNLLIYRLITQNKYVLTGVEPGFERDGAKMKVNAYIK
jgi:hypothetical protein